MNETFEYLKKNCTFKVSSCLLLMFGALVAVVAVLMAVGIISEPVARVMAAEAMAITLISVISTVTLDCGKTEEGNIVKLKRAVSFITAALLLCEMVDTRFIKFDSSIKSILGFICCIPVYGYLLRICSTIFVYLAKSVDKEFPNGDDNQCEIH